MLRERSTLIKVSTRLERQFTSAQVPQGAQTDQGKLLTRSRPQFKVGAAANGWNLPLTSALKARVTYSALVSVAPARSRLTPPLAKGGTVPSTLIHVPTA
jgi:hypothetical protein